ncbi:MAG: hypothetical protein LBQ54_14320 [Planctomycetaceae bacterium]|nr:hypothetical protein [Planctomycetaceae bacterium]
MKRIPVSLNADEAFNTHDIVELTTGNQYPWAKGIRFDKLASSTKSLIDKEIKAVSCLEFHFKPIRMIQVDLPNKQGILEKKLVWYMVYSVTNQKWDTKNQNVIQQINKPVARETLPTLDLSITPGSSISSENIGEGTYQIKTEDVPIRFVPLFVLASSQENTAPQSLAGYTDQFIPLAFGAICQREDFGMKFESTISITDKIIQPGETVWGIAMWTGIDPRLNYFSVFVSGLSNAYRWENPDGSFKQGDAPGNGRKMVRKTLKLNFWRPGDAANLSENDIRYGVPIPPQVKVAQETQKEGRPPVDFEWVYR